MANEQDPVEEVVQPRAGVEPVAAAPAEGGADLPDDLLRIPAMQAVVAGSPGAFSAVLSQFEKRPEAKIISSNKDNLMKAGFGLYRSLDGQKGAVFNQLFVSPEEIQAADQAGQLETIAPAFDQLNMEVAGAGAANPVLAEGARPEGFRAGAAAPAAGPPPMAASAQKSVATKRANNLQPGSPTSGPVPGEGRLLNTILKPVV
jgi:hypothetical protein